MAGKILKGDIIGVDITSDLVRVVEAVRSADKVRVLNFVHEEFKPSVQKDALDVPRVLTSFIDGKKIKSSRLHCVIPCQNMCIRVVTMPVMPHKELSQAIRSKIYKYISVDLEQVYYTFSVVGQTEERGIKKLEVVFAAIQKKYLIVIFKSLIPKR